MIFKRINPSPDLEKIIDCYWIVENDDPTPHRQKIIPDGFCEIIFHYKDPYAFVLLIPGSNSPCTCWPARSAATSSWKYRQGRYNRG